MQISIPNLSLVVLIGPSGSGKSTFAQKHFLPTEVLSSDFCRGLVSDDANDQTATNDAFEVLHFLARKRFMLGRLTVVDATNVQAESRKPLIAIAREYHCLPVAIVFNLPVKLCSERNKDRPNRNLASRVVRAQQQQMRRHLKRLKYEGFRYIYRFKSEEEVNAATVERVPLWNDKREEHGPFDIIGDVHGCADELGALLQELGYVVVEERPNERLWGGKLYGHPNGRKAVFLGDIVDRGPSIIDSLRLVRNMVVAGHALCIPGNHDMKLLRKLNGRNVQITHGLERTLAEIETLTADSREVFLEEAAEFLHGLISHYVLDDGRLVVAHAGMKQEMQGRGSGKVREFALYGETTGETDEFGLPVRYDWAEEYRGSALVAYGHTPVPEPEWFNGTVNLDTGCVFGGRLTALRYPEKEFVSVRAAHTYCESVKPIMHEDDAAAKLTTQQQHDDLLDAEDVIGKRIINTRLRQSVIIREQNATAALEVMSRFAADPRWLIYLPPTMSPCKTHEQGVLEHPVEAFAGYRSIGIPRVVCQEKHMGSRAVVIVCRSEDAARERFGIVNDGIGIVYTRTGRRFFNDKGLEQELLARLRAAMDSSGFWETLDTDWACLDCELMPWSVKAQGLLRGQYAAVGAAAQASLGDAVSALEKTVSRKEPQDGPGPSPASSPYAGDSEKILAWYRERKEMMLKYADAYRRYCWPVQSIDDLKLAPFHLLATEGKVHVDKDHVWHMETLSKICATDPDVLLATTFEIVDVTDPDAEARAIAWWEDLTARGSEGMVVKPLEFISRGRRGLAQPAVKVRGQEYLRIIYGPEYTAPHHVERLRSRGLGAKRSLALREFALGVEALERFIRREPLRRVHECVFGVLALESSPVDPRL